MKPLLLSDELSPVSLLSQVGKSTFGRRDFVKKTALIGAGLALLPTVTTDVFAEPTEAGVWRDRLTDFVVKICEGDYRKAEAINSLIRRSRIDFAPAGRTFHWYYSAPLIFVTTIDPQQVICHHGFELRSFPFYDLQLPVRNVNDLNAFEVRRVANDREISRLGCIVAPNGGRTPVDAYRDHADYSQTVSSYRLNPTNFKANYKRVFTGTNGRSRYGYQIEHKTDVGPSGKPLRDVLLSDRDW